VGKVLNVADRASIDAVAAEVAAELGPRDLVRQRPGPDLHPPEEWAGHGRDSMAVVPHQGGDARDAAQAAAYVVERRADSGGKPGLRTVSKAGLNALMRSCAHEGGPYGIRCNIVTMGFVRGTRFADVLHPEMVAAEVARNPLGQLPHADDIAEAVAFLASDRARYITGETLNVDAGGYMRY
jgi:hypothetical protein